MNIAERAGLATHSRIDLPLDFRGMARKSPAHAQEQPDSLVNLDSKLARQVRAADDEVDEINRHMYHIIETYIRQNPEKVGKSLHMLSAVRHLEQIADQATNICEDVIYMVEGEYRPPPAGRLLNERLLKSTF